MESNAPTIEEANARYQAQNDGGERARTEQIDGKIFLMSPSPRYQHSIIASNICRLIANALHKTPCRVFNQDLGFKYHPGHSDKKKSGDYVTPDITIVCGKSQLKGGSYYGVPKFVAEVTSPSTAVRDRTVKFKIYEEAGVSEYWIITPAGTIEIYYLIDGAFKLQHSIMRIYDKNDEEYNENMLITLRDYSTVKMTIGDIFEI